METLTPPTTLAEYILRPETRFVSLLVKINRVGQVHSLDIADEDIFAELQREVDRFVSAYPHAENEAAELQSALDAATDADAPPCPSVNPLQQFMPNVDKALLGYFDGGRLFPSSVNEMTVDSLYV